MWVALGWKTIETRRHARLACLVHRRKRIAIHAAKKWDLDWIKKASLYLADWQYEETVRNRYDWPRMALICTVLPDEHRRLIRSDSQHALRDCSKEDLFGLVFNDVQRFDPIPWKGHQGIMKVPEEVIPR